MALPTRRILQSLAAFIFSLFVVNPIAHGASVFNITTTEATQQLSVGSTASITYNIQNTSSLAITDITYSPPEFTTLASTTCGSTLNPGANCTANLTLTAPSPPGAYGPLNFTVCGFGDSVCSTTDSNNAIQLTVTTGPVGFSISPLAATINIIETEQFTATGAPGTVTWNSSDTNIATIDSNGLATATTTPGTTNITASSNGKTTSPAVLTVVAPAITVTPATATINILATQQFSQTGATGTVTWNSSNTNVATIDNTGLATATTTQGTTNITATSNGITSNQATLNVTAAAIIVSPGSATINILGTQQFTQTGATGTVTWSSSNTAVATIDSNTGLATATTTPGTTNITATSNGVTSTPAVLTVVAPSITVSPGSATINTSSTQQFTQTGATGTVTWNSSNTNVATIDNTGLATSTAMTGTTNITATSNGVTSNQATLTVVTAGMLTVATATNTNSTFVQGTTYLSLPSGITLNIPYKVTNISGSAISNPTISSPPPNTTVSATTCGGSLASQASCTITLTLTSPSVTGVQDEGTFNVTVCGNGGSACGTTTDQIHFIARQAYPLPFAGNTYLLYQPIPSTSLSTSMPFNLISTMYFAFGHAYPTNNQGQPTYPNNSYCPKTAPSNTAASLQFESEVKNNLGIDEPSVLNALKSIALQDNSNMKFLISLGWGHYDWTCIAADYTNGINYFPTSVVNFIRTNGLDGFDIDDESINRTNIDPNSGYITQPQYDAVALNIRQALDQASIADNKQYYFTTSVAWLNPHSPNTASNLAICGVDPTTDTGPCSNIDPQTMYYYDLILPQTYFNNDQAIFFTNALEALNYPQNYIIQSMNTQYGTPTACTNGPPTNPQWHGGIWEWAFVYDWQNCSAAQTGLTYDFAVTHTIAKTVGYPP